MSTWRIVMLKAIIVFDTVHGSTGEVAEAIAEEIRGISGEYRPNG